MDSSTDLPPIPPEGLMQVLAAVDLASWSGSARIVQFIGSHEGGCRASIKALEALLGMSRSWLGQLLKRLVDDRVLLCVEAAAGSRAAVYEVNPNVLEWDRVPWRVTPELVWHRLTAFHDKHHQVTNGPRSRFVTQSYTAPQSRSTSRSGPRHKGKFAARSITASQTVAGAPSRRGQDVVTNLDQWPISSRGSNPASPRKGFTSVHLTDDLISSSSAADEKEKRIVSQNEALMIRTIQKRARARFVAPSLKEQILKLLDEHGEDSVLEALDRCQTGFGLPSLISQLEIELWAGPASTENPPDDLRPDYWQPDPAAPDADFAGGIISISAIKAQLGNKGMELCENGTSTGE